MDELKAVDILLVEDNPEDIELTIRALKKKKLVNQVFVAKDGAEALDFLFQRGAYINREPDQTPKVVLLDLKLPKVSGMEVLKEVKKEERTRNIPVVVMASSREDPDIQSAYRYGANSYVVKPVDSDVFLEIMSNLGFYWLLINQPPKTFVY